MESEFRFIKVTTSRTARTASLTGKHLVSENGKQLAAFQSRCRRPCRRRRGPSVLETEINVLLGEHRMLNALSRVSRVFFFFWKFVLSCFINTLKMSKNQRAHGTKTQILQYSWHKGKCFNLYIAYFCVHSLACLLYFSLSDLQICAISGTKGSSGLGSQSREHIDNKTFDTVKAGDHWDLRMSRQILPLLFIFGWQIFVVKAIFGGLKGQSVGKWTVRKKTPP